MQSGKVGERKKGFNRGLRAEESTEDTEKRRFGKGKERQDWIIPSIEVRMLVARIPRVRSG